MYHNKFVHLESSNVQVQDSSKDFWTTLHFDQKSLEFSISCMTFDQNWILILYKQNFQLVLWRFDRNWILYKYEVLQRIKIWSFTYKLELPCSSLYKIQLAYLKNLNLCLRVCWIHFNLGIEVLHVLYKAKHS
jgi:hypothetical protein